MGCLDIQKEIREIKKRNARVEADKAGETSWTRKIIILLLNYVVMVIFFFSAELPKPWVNSIVPALAFVLSTLSLPYLKKMWLNKRMCAHGHYLPQSKTQRH